MRKKNDPDAGNPQIQTIPPVALQHFDIYTVDWTSREEMALELTKHQRDLARRTRSVCTILGFTADEQGLTFVTEYWNV